MNVLKAIGHGLLWLGKNLLWKPLVWVATESWKAFKPKKKDGFKTESAVSDAQDGASKHLPALRKKKDELAAEMKKLEDKWEKLYFERQKVEAVVYVGSGECFKERPPRRPNRNNNQQKQKGQNNNQQQGKDLPAIADAVFPA